MATSLTDAKLGKQAGTPDEKQPQTKLDAIRDALIEGEASGEAISFNADAFKKSMRVKYGQA